MTSDTYNHTSRVTYQMIAYVPMITIIFCQVEYGNYAFKYQYQGSWHPILTITALQGSRSQRVTYVPITVWGEGPYVSFTVVWWSFKKGTTRLDVLCNQDQRLHVPRQRMELVAEHRLIKSQHETLWGRVDNRRSIENTLKRYIVERGLLIEQFSFP